jgi:hypothetical protein
MAYWAWIFLSLWAQSFSSLKELSRYPEVWSALIPNAGFDHGAGHPLLLLCNAKAPNYSNNKAFNDLAHYSEWPKVAGAVIKAQMLIQSRLP